MYLNEVMDNYKTCGNHFMVYISKSIILYTLNLYVSVCQLYLKNGKKIDQVTKKKFKKSHCRIQHPLKTELDQIKSDTLDSLRTLREA